MSRPMNRLSADADFVSNKCAQVDDLRWKSRPENETRNTGGDLAGRPPVGRLRRPNKRPLARPSVYACNQQASNQQMRSPQFSADAP
jgi:hypothetical protein